MTDEHKQLRRKRWNGLHPDDVSKALAELAKRNLDVARELAASNQRELALEQELDSFKSALRQLSGLLTLAEERAAQIERDARELAEESLREAARVDEVKRQTVAELVRLRGQIDDAVGAPLRAVG